MKGGPRCGRAVYPRRGPAMGLLTACGRPEGHAPPCRSRAALAAYRITEREYQDRMRRERGGTGDYRVKLNPKIVTVARARHDAEGLSYAALARVYRVDSTTMRDAVTGASWRQVPAPP